MMISGLEFGTRIFGEQTGLEYKWANYIIKCKSTNYDSNEIMSILNNILNRGQ